MVQSVIQSLTTGSGFVPDLARHAAGQYRQLLSSLGIEAEAAVTPSGRIEFTSGAIEETAGRIQDRFSDEMAEILGVPMPPIVDYQPVAGEARRRPELPGIGWVFRGGGGRHRLPAGRRR